MEAGVSAPRYAVALPLPRYAGSGIRAQFVERRLYPGNQCGWQASIGERFQKILTLGQAPAQKGDQRLGDFDRAPILAHSLRSGPTPEDLRESVLRFSIRWSFRWTIRCPI